jgi:hypothetical protein
LDANKNFEPDLKSYAVLSINRQPVTSSQHPIFIGIIIAILMKQLSFKSMLLSKSGSVGLKRTGGLQ